MATVLSTTTAGSLLDDGSYDGLLVAVWTFIAGGIYGAFAYFVLGALLDRSVKALGSQGTYRRSRQVLAFAAVPIALSLVLWPVKLALYGEDVFRSGGRDGGAGAHVFPTLFAAFLAWSIVLLVIGVRAVHGWTWVALGRGDRAGTRAPGTAPRSRSARSVSDASNRSSSSGEIPYVCFSSGNAPVADVRRVRSDGVADLSGDLGVALDEAWCTAGVHPEHVVPDEHLAVGPGARADADRRHLERLRDTSRDGSRHRLEHDRERPCLLQRERVVVELLRRVGRASLRLEAAELRRGLRGQARRGP